MLKCIRKVQSLAFIMKNPLSEKAKEIVWGTLFGDGCLRKPSGYRYVRKDGTQGQATYRHFKLQIRHSPQQKEYAWWLYDHLKPLCHSEPKVYKNINRKLGKEYYCIDVVTRCHSYFTRLRGYFYPEGKKVVKRKHLNKLTQLGLAVWFMDDGTSDGKRVWLCTNCYSREENVIIAKYFKDRWGISPSVVKERAQWKIAFNSFSADFCKIVKPYILLSMQYKLVS